MTVFIHALSDVHSKHIGNGTRIWQFCVVLSDAKIGKDCNICSHSLLENKVKLGDRVTVKSGVFIWDNTIIEDDVFIGPNATFTNDKYPRSRNAQFNALTTTIKAGASIGANATLLPGITIGNNSIVGAGAVVVKDVEPNTIVAGNPAIAIGINE